MQEKIEQQRYEIKYDVNCIGRGKGMIEKMQAKFVRRADA